MSETRRLVRWRALVPLALFLMLVVAAWLLFADKAVEWSVEEVGAQVVGAQVDVEAADIRLNDGFIMLSGMQVANPDSPMQNLFEASEIIAAVQKSPLLEKKFVIDSVAVRGVRFGTPRETSGELADKRGSTGVIYQRVSAWAQQIRLPEFSLEGLASQVVNVPALSLDSLRTIAQARAVISSADSARRGWETQLAAIDPRPRIDSARALIERLRTLDVRTLGLQGLREQVTSAQAAVNGLNQSVEGITTLEQDIKGGVEHIRELVNGLEAARRADYAYARGLVDLPSLDAPDISPALFGQVGVDHLRPVLYWISIAEQYLPPGLDPRRRLGPDRVRAAGLSVDFPRLRDWPKFLVKYADFSFALGGDNAAAGDYRAQLAGLTNQPTVYGGPLQIVAERAGGRAGPATVRVAAQLNHTARPLRDSASALLGGFKLPVVPLAPLGVRLDMGEGTTQLVVRRTGDQLYGQWTVRSTQPRWERLDTTRSAAGGGVGAQARVVAEDLVWATLSGLREVEVQATISGTLSSPSFTVRSNVGNALAESLKRQLGAQLERAERLVRAKVDSVIQQPLAQAQGRLAGIRTEIEEKVAAQRAELEQVKRELEERIRGLTPTLPGGIRLPR